MEFAKIAKATNEELEARLSEIRGQMDAPEADIEALTKEVEAVEARKKELASQETGRRALAEKIAAGEAGTVTKEAQVERTMPKIELRNTAEYGNAFVKAVISGDDTELRALLSSNAVTGSVPVPTMLDNEIRNAWEKAQLLSLVKQTSYKGNVKVGFEYSATGATIHVEGTEAPEEETLVLGAVELKAETIKKWITVSDEAIEGTTIDTLQYIYAELAQKIAEYAEEILINKITSAPTTSTKTAVAVAETSASDLDIDTITLALAELSGKARNIHIAMNRKTYAMLKSVQLKAKYAADPFDGLKDRVIFTDALKGFGDAGNDDTVIIAGDFGYGAQANRPNGDELTIKVDDLSLAEKDLVKVVGKQYVGIGIVAPKAFVRVKKTA